MSEENFDDPLIPRSPLPRRLVYQCKMAVKQPSEDVLLVRMGVLTQLSVYAIAAVVCWGCLPFAAILFGRLFGPDPDLGDDSLVFEVLATVAMAVNVVLVVATLLLLPIRFDRAAGTIGRGGWVPGWWQRDLNDLLAVQVCHGNAHVSHGDRARDTRVESQYQVNLVFRGSPPTRKNLSEQWDLSWARRMAREVAEFAGKPVLNYVAEFGTEGRVGTEPKADAEARALMGQLDAPPTSGG